MMNIQNQSSNTRVMTLLAQSPVSMHFPIKSLTYKSHVAQIEVPTASHSNMKFNDERERERGPEVRSAAATGSGEDCVMVEESEG